MKSRSFKTYREAADFAEKQKKAGFYAMVSVLPGKSEKQHDIQVSWGSATTAETYRTKRERGLR